MCSTIGPSRSINVIWSRIGVCKFKSKQTEASGIPFAISQMTYYQVVARNGLLGHDFELGVRNV